MTFDFSNKEIFNEAYIPMLYDESRYKILYGGRDSGKSDFIAQALIISLLKEDFCRILLIRKYLAHIRKSQFQTILDYVNMWKLKDCFHITENPLGMTCTLNGNQLFALGLDRPDNIKSTKDPTQVWYEEADQIPADAFRITSQSVRSSRTKKLVEWISFNPQREHFHVNKYFFPLKNTYEKDDGNFLFVPSIQPNTTILHTTYRQNRFITPDRIQTLESYKNLDYNYYKVNSLGLWGGAPKGLIYTDWSVVEEFPENGDEVIAIDYGFNNPTAILRVSFYEKQLYIQQLEYFSEQTHTEVVRCLNEKHHDTVGHKLIIVDSAAPELVRELRNYGFNARSCDKGAASVYEGIMATKNYKLNVTSDSDAVIKELQSYHWKETKDGIINDEPVKVEDHAMDAMRYAVQSYGKYNWILQERTSDKPRYVRRHRNYNYYGM